MALIPSHHGLLQIHSLPRPISVVPPSDKLSTLRGLSSASTTSSAGGAGENNIAYKVTRKRFLFETFHLDVDGGVGERRTELASTTIAMANDTHATHAHGSSIPRSDISSSTEQRASAIQVEYDKSPALDTTDAVTTIEKPNTSGTRPKKKVAFISVKPDLFDF